MVSDRPYDIVLYGATGFTGGLIARYLSGRLFGGGPGETVSPDLHWAIAGRNRAKLEARRAELDGAGDIGLIVADTEDLASLRAMASQARVVMTTVGPYALYGEPLVAACIEAGTDYVDLTGEPTWWREIVDRYHERAVARDVLIIPGCGFDCIPADMGALFTAMRLPTNQPMTIDAYVRARGSASGGTTASALEAMRELGRDGARSGSGKGVGGKLLQRVEALDMWALPSPVLDPLVVRRSAELQQHSYGDELRYRQYFGFRRRLEALGALAFVGVLYGAAKLSIGRKLITKLRPSGSGPDQETRDKSWFRFDFIGRGGGREVRAHVSGGDPGYTETSKMMSEAAIMLVEARDQLPLSGGVATPASGLGVAFIERLQAVGIEFAIDE